jgi:hypothetical protein
VPRTLVGSLVAELTPEAGGQGNGDALDVCVLCERPPDQAEVLLDARVVGGIRTLDEGRADDKILTVFEEDGVCGEVAELGDVPAPSSTGSVSTSPSTRVRAAPVRRPSSACSGRTARHTRTRWSMPPSPITRAPAEALGGRDEAGGSDDR